MKLNYEGYAEADNGRRYLIQVTRQGRFYVAASDVPGASADLTGLTPEEVQAGLDAWLVAAENMLETQREERRTYTQEKKKREQEVVNTEAWLIREYNLRNPTNEREFLDTFRVSRVTVRGRKARTRGNEALITIGNDKTSRPVNDLRLGSAEDIEEYKALRLARWKASQAAQAAKEPWSYRKFYGTGFGAPDKDFKARVDNATATYNGDGTWTISGEGIEDFVADQDILHNVESEVERRMAAIKHPYTMVDAAGKGYKTEEQVVIPVLESRGYSQPDYVFPDRETAQSVVEAHNASVKARKAIEAWTRAHRYTFGWEGQEG